MSLAAPIALGLVLLAAPVVWAFLARRRAPKKVVGSVILMRAALAKARTRVVAPRIRHPIALVLTLLALFSVVVGLAGPRCGAAAGGDLIVVVDTSASMGREAPGGESRLETARRDLGTPLQALGRGQRAALVVAAAEPRVEVGRTLDAPAVGRAIQALQAGGEADLVGALVLADTLCLDPEKDSILVVSDGATRLPELRCPVRRVHLPAGGDDIGITALSARRADGLGLFEVVLGVSSSGGATRPVEVALRVDGQLIDSAALDVPGGGTAWSLRRLDVPGRVLEARLVDVDDADAGNNVAHAVRASVPPVRVGLVTDAPAGFLATALALHPSVDLAVRAPAQAEQLDGVDLLVLEARPERLPASGRAVAFGPEPARALGLDVGARLEAPRVTRWSFDAELLRLVDLDDLVVQQAHPLQVPGDGGVLLEVEGQPVLVHGTTASRPVVAVGFAPDDSDLVLRIGFLHLVANLIDWASPHASEPEGAEVGRVWPGALGDEGLVATTGDVTPAWKPVPPAGLLDVRSADGEARTPIAARPAGPGEVLPAADALQAIPVAAAGGAGGMPWWVWAVAMGLALLALETTIGAALAWWARLVGGRS